MADKRAEQPMPLFVAVLPFNDGETNGLRAALVLRPREDYSSVLRMTNKRPITYLGQDTRYFALTDWQDAGFSVPMYVDTARVYEIDTPIMTSRAPLGQLSVQDTVNLYAFMKRHQR